MPASASPRVTVSALWAEGRGRPEFLAVGAPSLSWQVTTDIPDWTQESYEIEREVAGRTESAAVESSESQHRAWPFAELGPYASSRVRVRVVGSDSSASEFGEWVELRTGPLVPDDWRAPFIAAALDSTADEAEGETEPDFGTTRFRTEFTPTGEVVSAVLSATAHGVYEAVLNGRPVGDEVLAPGWTAYADRLTFQSYDVTALVTSGTNVLGATVAAGWYGEHFGFDGNFGRVYEGQRALSAQLRLEYADGSVEFVTTDDTWNSTFTGPVTSAGIYPGEDYDARLEDDTLATPGASFPDERGVSVVAADAAILTPSFSPPVRRIETVAAVTITTSPSGATLIDFGQNLVGWLELAIDAPAGHEVTLRHAEVLENGELGVRPLRFAKAIDRFTGDGGGERAWSPSFTFHGFRYAEVTNWPGELGPDDIRAVVLHSDMVRTGDLVTSNPKLNQLHRNVVWGMRGNFLSLPTDCPQRDERLGWTGDIQVFTPTASYLYDASGFLESWLRDLAADQANQGGAVPIVVPNITGQGMPAAAWGDAATLVPDALYERFGDAGVLATQFESMKAWVDVVDALAGDDHLWTGGFQFGDWLDPSAPPHNPAAAKTDADIVATAYFFRSTSRLAAAASVLGRDEDPARYGALAEAIRTAFVDEYVTPAGRLLSDAHTAYALAIAFDLVTDPALVAKAGARLAELVRSHGYRIGTGFVGTPLICDALCRGGQSEVAFRLLLEEGLPSWLYPISMGATTIWERWDSMLPDGSINPGEMTSFNHYALGAVADWMQRSIGGLAPGTPGYRSIVVAPLLGGGITSSRATLDSGYGPVSVEWTLAGTDFSLDVIVPPNTTAEVRVPGSAAAVVVGSGSHSWQAEVSAVVARPPVAELSMETSLSEIVGDVRVRSALEGLFAELGYFIGLGWTSSGRWKSNTPLGKSLIMMPPEGVARVESLMHELNAR